MNNEFFLRWARQMNERESKTPPTENAVPSEPGSGSFSKQFESSTNTRQIQGELDGRLLMLRRVLLTAVEMIEEIVVPVNGGEK